MKYPAKSVFDLIPVFTPDKDAQLRLEVYLGELPIGDEYKILTEADWKLGERFHLWCQARGDWKEEER